MRMRMDIYSYEYFYVCVHRCVMHHFIKYNFIYTYIYGKSRMNLIQRCIYICAIIFYVYNRNRSSRKRRNFSIFIIEFRFGFSKNEFFVSIVQHARYRKSSFLFSWHRQEMFKMADDDRSDQTRCCLKGGEDARDRHGLRIGIQPISAHLGNGDFTT